VVVGPDFPGDAGGALATLPPGHPDRLGGDAHKGLNRLAVPLDPRARPKQLPRQGPRSGGRITGAFGAGRAFDDGPNHGQRRRRLPRPDAGPLRPVRKTPAAQPGLPPLATAGRCHLPPQHRHLWVPDHPERGGRLDPGQLGHARRHDLDHVLDELAAGADERDRRAAAAVRPSMVAAPPHRPVEEGQGAGCRPDHFHPAVDRLDLAYAGVRARSGRDGPLPYLRRAKRPQHAAGPLAGSAFRPGSTCSSPTCRNSMVR
jgi:hypothetical protein